MCTAVASLFAFCIHCAFYAAAQMNGKLLDLIMSSHIELIPGSIVKRKSDWFMPLSFRAFSFDSVKTL